MNNSTVCRSINVIQTWVRNYTFRRALLYVPGDNERKVSKAFTVGADCIALDCEDGVALNKKGEARNNIRNLLDVGKPERSRPYDLGIRINPVASDLCKEDLNACLSGNNLPDTILLPKVENSAHLNWFAGEVDSLIKGDKFINLIMYIESALSFVNIIDICKSAQDLSHYHKFKPVALVFGSDDFCANIGATRTEDSTEIFYARQKLVLTAKAFQLQAIDMVYIKYKDLAGLKSQAEQGMRMGYTGKQVIHPDQVPVVQTAFLPTQVQIDWATGLMKAFEEHQTLGKGAFNYQGSMIDMPTMKQARNILELAKLK